MSAPTMYAPANAGMFRDRTNSNYNAGYPAAARAAMKPQSPDYFYGAPHYAQYAYNANSATMVPGYATRPTPSWGCAPPARSARGRAPPPPPITLPGPVSPKPRAVPAPAPTKPAAPNFLQTPPSAVLRIIPPFAQPAAQYSLVITYKDEDGTEHKAHFLRAPERHEIAAEVEHEALLSRTEVDKRWEINYPDVDYTSLGYWQEMWCHTTSLIINVYTRVARNGEKPGVIYNPVDAQM